MLHSCWLQICVLAPYVSVVQMTLENCFEADYVKRALFHYLTWHGHFLSCPKYPSNSVGPTKQVNNLLHGPFCSQEKKEKKEENPKTKNRLTQNYTFRTYINYRPFHKDESPLPWASRCNQCLGRFGGIINWNPSVSKSNCVMRWYLSIFFNNLRNIL